MVARRPSGEKTRQVFVTSNAEKVLDDLIAVPKPPQDVIDRTINDPPLDWDNEVGDVLRCPASSAGSG